MPTGASTSAIRKTGATAIGRSARCRDRPNSADSAPSPIYPKARASSSSRAATIASPCSASEPRRSPRCFAATETISSGCNTAATAVTLNLGLRRGGSARSVRFALGICGRSQVRLCVRMLGRSTATPGYDTSSPEWVAAIKSPRQFRNLPLPLLPQLAGHCPGMERVMGIEPTLAAWEAAVLPLNYTRAPG